jgi:hypothetical protein
MPNLSPEIFSAHDHAEGEFFSAANENAGQTAEAAQDRQGQADPLRCRCDTASTSRLGSRLGNSYRKSLIAMSVMSVSVTAHAALAPGPN